MNGQVKAMDRYFKNFEITPEGNIMRYLLHFVLIHKYILLICYGYGPSRTC